MVATVRREKRKWESEAKGRKEGALSRSKSYCQTTGVILALRRTEPHHDHQPTLTARPVAPWRCPLSIGGVQGCSTSYRPSIPRQTSGVGDLSLQNPSRMTCLYATPHSTMSILAYWLAARRLTTLNNCPQPALPLPDKIWVGRLRLCRTDSAHKVQVQSQKGNYIDIKKCKQFYTRYNSA